MHVLETFPKFFSGQPIKHDLQPMTFVLQHERQRTKYHVCLATRHDGRALPCICRSSSSRRCFFARFARWKLRTVLQSIIGRTFCLTTFTDVANPMLVPMHPRRHGHQNHLVLPGECVQREGDSGGLWCIGASRWGSCLCCCNYLSWRRDFACPLLAIAIVKRIFPRCRRKRITTACKRFYGFRLGLFFAVAT